MVTNEIASIIIINHCDYPIFANNNLIVPSALGTFSYGQMESIMTKMEFCAKHAFIQLCSHL